MKRSGSVPLFSPSSGSHETQNRANRKSLTGKFRKKPVEIEAYQFHNKACRADDRPAWLLEAVRSGKVRFHDWRPGDPHHLIISTLEGAMRAEDGDWIIQGIKGEIYPCKPDIFAATYEPVEE